MDVPKQWTWLGARSLLRLIRTLQPEVIIERYYNFAGVGMWAAHKYHIPALLEVNALIIDPPGTRKRRIDALLGKPMQRWALRQCHQAHYIVTPLHTTVPDAVPREKIVELSWGANVERFEQIDHYKKARKPPDPPVAVFLGSFRAWHGVLNFMRAATMLLNRGKNYRFILIGDGPERIHAQGLAAEWRDHFTFTGELPYEEVPRYLYDATAGVAPFNTTEHPALQAAGFYWSPLKIFEYMAANLPVVTTDLHPLNEIIREGEEGALFPEGDVEGLMAALERVMDNPKRAVAMGHRARTRVAEHYSWQHHCTELERLLMKMVYNVSLDD
jgi:glycosyltransferase involved in cell wall biosynthesis